MVGLLENGTHVLAEAQLSAYSTSERTIAVPVCTALTADMLCLADRGFLSFDLLQIATASGAARVHAPRAGTRPRDGVGDALSRALGNRDCL